MNRGARIPFLFLSVLAGLVATALPAAALLELQKPEWMTNGTTVQFHLRFMNTGPETVPPVDVMVHSQYYGVFNQNYGLIGQTTTPPIPPDSFFDVFFDVDLSSLPMTYETLGHSPGESPGREFRPAADCAPGDHWDGNIDVIWSGGAGGHANYHIGDIKVCPDGGNSYIHMITGCDVAPGMTWSLAGGCPGWTATLVNEDYTPAPPVLPPFWTGFICIHADASVPVGQVCCWALTFSCGAASSTVDICATACDCTTPVTPSTWGRIKALYR